MRLSAKLSHAWFTTLLWSLATVACVGVLFNLTATPAMAQAAAGTISGQITDAQGAVIAGAEVKAVEVSTSSTRTTTSNEVGRYTFSSLPVGNYDITVTKTGFTAAKMTAQHLEVGGVLTLDIPLQVGVTTTTVEVQATAGAELQTLNATVGATITNESLNLMPNLGRDASTLSVLQVGVTPTGNVGGAGTDQNSFQLDGGNNSDDMAGNNTGYVPGNGYIGSGSSGGTPSGVIPTPIESIEEIKVGSSNQTADFNSAGGSQVQMVTKRGTNQFHGALYEFYFANNVGAANLWKNNHTPSAQYGTPYTPLPATHRNRFGGAVGGPLTPRFWGGKTYFFANYEGMRYPNGVTFERAVPTALLKAGVVQFQNTSGVYTPYNLNPFAVTVNGTTYQPAQCAFNGASGPCDPRNIGLNQQVAQLWKQMPLPNDPSYTSGGSDGVNAQGYLGSLALPISSNFYVVRLDHDFGDKWKFMSSYRYYGFSQQTSNQTTISPTGQYTATAPRPVKPDYIFGGLTTTITANLTNDLRVSYLRNWWQWSDAGGPPNIPGLGGALEPLGESAGTNALLPTNVNSQSTRQRFWDGQDQFYSDNLNLLHGNHLFQFGGSYLRNFDYHARNDNGVGIDSFITYQATNGTGIASNGYPTPAGMAASQITSFDQYYSAVLGIVGQSQVMYSRSGANLTLNPVGSNGFDQSIIPTYNFYWSDTWHIKPSLTLTYGLAWQLALPPYEINGKQVMLVGQSGTPLNLEDFLAQRQKAALNGQGYAPTVGFATVPNVGSGEKYPYNTFYGSFSPRVSFAWSPNADNGIMGKVLGRGKTVVRGGYSRIYGRTNGVELVLVPLLGAGILQAVSCLPSMTGTCANAGTLTAANAFRIGTDGMAAPLPAVSQTLPQPYFPGINGNAQASDGSLLDPNYQPNHSDEVNFTIQRAFSNKAVLEVGYIGKKLSNVFQQINIDAVPYMTTLNGQSFAQAYSAVYSQYCGLSGPTCAGNASNVTAQPFFEAALGGKTSPFCATSASCTAAVVSSFGSSIKATQVFSLWQSIDRKNGWTLGRTLLGSPALGGSTVGSQITAMELDTSLGYGNYNAAFVRFTTKDYRGLTISSNFTWSRGLGTASVNSSTSSATVPDPWNLHEGYGPLAFDYKVVYSLLTLYQPPFFRSQKGLAGHILGGWTIAPILTAQSGAPLQINVGTGSNENAQALGEVYGNNNTGLYENAVSTSPYQGGNSLQHTGGSGGVGTSGNTGLNLFANPQQVYNSFRPPVLGTDFNLNGNGPIRGFPTWNVDATVSKDFAVKERFGATIMFQFVNVFNHFQPANPGSTNTTASGTSFTISNPATFGVINNQATTPNGAQSRWIEFGLRLRF